MNSVIAKERLACVVKPDSVTTTQGDFLATHVAMKKLVLLNKFESVPTKDIYYTEEEIYEKYVRNPSNIHQFIAVYGQSGTGKSHLIRWFEARYAQDRPDNEVVLFIRRSDNTLKGTIRQLLEKQEVQEISNKDIIKRLVNASATMPEEKLKDMIYHHFIIEINNDDESNDITLTNVKRKKLVTFLNNETIYRHMLEADGPIERIYSKIAENSLVDRDTVAEFQTEDFLVSPDLFEKLVQAEPDPKAERMARALMADNAADEARKLADYLNQFVPDVIQYCAGIEPGDFEQIFMDIRKELFRQGKNLTLFIEDVTSFTGVDGALLNVLLEDHSQREICRISSVVGGTRGYLEKNFQDNHKDRVTQYVYIPDDVFDENGIYEFVAKYLNTMSLPETEIRQWLLKKATMEEYPVHEVTEGKEWEFVPIGYGKELCLYPFTKRSILYLYHNRLEKGQQTPRYMIRDLIEPVVNDVLYNKEAFPDAKYSMVNVNTTLNFMIHNQIREEKQFDRLLRFLSIWGNNKPEQYTREGVTYIAGIKKEILEDLNFPVLRFQEGEAPTEFPSQPETLIRPKDDTAKVPEQIAAIPEEKERKLNHANELLTRWIGGAPINLSTTGGTEGMIRAAREDMGEFLFSAINWQAAGISVDNINKVKAAVTGRGNKYKLVALANQIQGDGYYTLPAAWDSLNVIIAFIRWREYGNQSWNYPKADFDVFLVTSWVSRIKGELLQAVKRYDDRQETKYIEAAVSAEIYRLILKGEFCKETLKSFSIEYLFKNHPVKNTGAGHCAEWEKLLTVTGEKGADQINRDTVRQYFNLIQGDGGPVVVLDSIKLEETMKKVQARRLQIPAEEFQAEDRVKLRKDVYEYYGDIAKRVKDVAEAEQKKAQEQIRFIHDSFDEEEIGEEDVKHLLLKAKEFYKEVNNAQINMPVRSLDFFQKKVKTIVKSIITVEAVLNEKDPLTILMAFSDDPIADLIPFCELLRGLEGDLEKAEKNLAIRRKELEGWHDESDGDGRYKEEWNTMENDKAILEKLRR